MKQSTIFWLFIVTMTYLIQPLRAEDGYRLWLRYDLVSEYVSY